MSNRSYRFRLASGTTLFAGALLTTLIGLGPLRHLAYAEGSQTSYQRELVAGIPADLQVGRVVQIFLKPTTNGPTKAQAIILLPTKAQLDAFSRAHKKLGGQGMRLLLKEPVGHGGLRGTIDAIDEEN